MRRRVENLGSKFRRHWKNYVFQSLFAIITVILALLLLNIQERPIIVASVGATAFIVFALPKDSTANTANVIGGHLIGLLSGSLATLLPVGDLSIVAYSVAVGLSIFLMVITDLEHPPASGTALSIATRGFSYNGVTGLMISVVIMASVHYFFRNRLRNLR